MSFETDFDAAFTILLGKAAGVITQTGVVVGPQPVTGDTTGIVTPRTAGIEFVIGDGSNVITTGPAGGLVVPFDCVITEVELQEFEGTTGSININIQKGVAGSSPTFSSIVGSFPPTISGSRHYADASLTGWTTDLSRGDVLKFLVSTISSFKRVTLVLYVRSTT